MPFIILLFIIISTSFLIPKKEVYAISSQTYFQYDFYVSKNIDGFKEGFFLPNGTLGFNLNIFDKIPFLRLSIHADVSYFHFNQDTVTNNEETTIVNTEKIFQTIENNIIVRLKEIQGLKRELNLISIDKITQYTEEFNRKLTIQFQSNLNEKVDKISENFVPLPKSKSDIAKGAFSGLLSGLAASLKFAEPIVSLIPGAGQIAAQALPIGEQTLNTISGLISSTMEKSVDPDSDAYKAGSVIEKIPGIYWIGTIIKAAEEVKLRNKLLKIRKNRLKSLDIYVAKYRNISKNPGGLETLKTRLNNFKNENIPVEERYEFLSLSKVLIEEEAKINLQNLAKSSASQQVDAEMKIIRNRLEKEERSIKAEAEDIAQKRALREAEIQTRFQDDKYIRIPIAIGTTLTFKVFFFTPYIETSVFLSVDHSYRTQINKIHFGIRFGCGLQFEFLDGRLFFGLNVRYWLVHNSFFTFGPRIGFRI